MVHFYLIHIKIEYHDNVRRLGIVKGQSQHVQVENRSGTLLLDSNRDRRSLQFKTSWNSGGAVFTY